MNVHLHCNWQIDISIHSMTALHCLCSNMLVSCVSWALIVNNQSDKAQLHKTSYTEAQVPKNYFTKLYNMHSALDTNKKDKLW